MTPREELILKGCRYIRGLKPSKLLLGSVGVIDPKEWNFLMRFVELVERDIQGLPEPEKPTQDSLIDKPIEKLSSSELHGIFS